jgi:hypothetical protein
MRKTIIATALFIAVGLPACGTDDGDGGGGGTPTVTITSDALDNGTLAAPRNREVTVRLEAKDGDGRATDPGSVSWSASGDGLEVTPNGATATVVMRRDWFDAPGSEPSATLTAESGGKTAEISVYGVIDANGRWKAVLGGGLNYPLDLVQVGRTVTDRGTRYSGSIDGDALSIDVAEFAIRGTFTSRDEARGTYSGGGTNGNIVCTRQ